MTRLLKPLFVVFAPTFAALFFFAAAAPDRGVIGPAQVQADVPHFCSGTAITQPSTFPRDSYVGSTSGEHIIGDQSLDYLLGYGGDDCLDGGDDASVGDQLSEEDDPGAPDVLRGGAGNDRLYGGTGDDTLYGEDGNDYLDAGGGTPNGALPPAETLLGGKGNDILISRNGADVIIAGDGTDQCWVGPNSQSGYDGNNIDIKTFGCEGPIHYAYP